MFNLLILALGGVVVARSDDSTVRSVGAALLATSIIRALDGLTADRGIS